MAVICINIPEMNILGKIEQYVVGEVVYKRAATFGPRVQGGLQVMYVYSGSARIAVDGCERILEAGEMTLLLPDHVEFFEFSVEEETHHGWCTGLTHELEEWSSRTNPELTSVWKMPPLIKPLTDRGIELRHRQSPSAQALYGQVAGAIFHEYFHAAGFPVQEEMPLPEPVRKACEWIDANYSESCTLDDIACAAGITGAHLIRLFREHLDVTPIRRLWAVRCDNGRRLLAETGLNVAEVAWQCGYKTPYHFSREFKARNGLSPRAYRNGKWKR